MPRSASAGAGRLDRVGWCAGTCVEAHGVRLGLPNERAFDDGRAAALPPPGARPSRSRVIDELFSVWVDPDARAARPSRVYVGGRRRVRTRDLRHALAVLESELRQSVAARSPRRAFVHAGVVGSRRGRAMVKCTRPQPQRQDDTSGRADPGGRAPLGRVRRARRARPRAPVRQAAVDPRRGRLRPSTCAGRAPRSWAAGARRHHFPSASWCWPCTSRARRGSRRRSRPDRP